ncbi:unnamed protein product (macronuclear) [Paramecium tetraurelia]|uniref:Transmembrane protein n=1 Tax=Paramecium tetraurelia TaxID=5888 RepID=A0DDG0_PARTE|nr:uncharacterized protein GSPATT00015936001 [Paramecium tetraurelia]CAK81077.1 unnamed protein product [Paramecium tetraurelia]|eukprot:XP_001448474.1 hypothetical protein (macronuclear) [Paramecium tetraurelia strain d4-2]
MYILNYLFQTKKCTIGSKLSPKKIKKIIRSIENPIVDQQSISSVWIEMQILETSLIQEEFIIQDCFQQFVINISFLILLNQFHISQRLLKIRFFVIILENINQGFGNLHYNFFISPNNYSFYILYLNLCCL